MATLIIKSGTTSIEGAIVKGSFSYFSGSTKDLGPTSTTGFYSGIDAPSGGYTVYQTGGPNGWTARIATDDSSLNSILIGAGATGSTLSERITWATNTTSVYVNSGPLPTYTIGQAALGGVIAYINGGGSSGTSGMVVSSGIYLSFNVAFGCSGNFSTSTGTNYGTGAANTTTILSQCATRPIAASVASTHNGGGYTDWFLPSSTELSILYNNKASIGIAWQNSQYWSSSQLVATNLVLTQNLSLGNTNQMIRTFSNNRVVACRYF